MWELEQIYEEIFGEPISRRIVPSETTPNIEYEVVFTKGGRMTCDCPGWMYKKECKHTEKVWKNLTPFQRAMFTARRNNKHYEGTNNN